MRSTPGPEPPLDTHTAAWRRLCRPASIAFLLAYYIYFVWHIFGARFSGDDMMNMDYYFKFSPLKLALIQWTPWSGYYRPMGGCFYMAIFSLAGLNPAPFHFVALLAIAANAYLTYRLARLLGCAELPASLAALVMCYHGGMPPLYYDTGFIYDILCCFFYLAAAVYYIRIRNQGRTLSAVETLGFLFLTLCALNSKEMAVTLPVALLAYECIYHPPARLRPRELFAWLVSAARAPLLAAVLALLSIYGIFFGAGALARQPAYGQEFSLNRLVHFQQDAFADLLLLHHPTTKTVAVIWITLSCLAWLMRLRVLRFCWIVMVVAPLPVTFLENRHGPCLYIPLIGWAIFAAVILAGSATRIAALLDTLLPWRHLAGRLTITILVAIAVVFWCRLNLPYRNGYTNHALADMGADITPVIQQLSTLPIHPSPHSVVAFLDDPLHTFDMAHIAELCFHDRSVTIWLESVARHTPQDLSHAEHIIDYRAGRFVVIR
jgi:hypothetical protein